MAEPVLTTCQVAALAGVTSRTIRNLIARGELVPDGKNKRGPTFHVHSLLAAKVLPLSAIRLFAGLDQEQADQKALHYLKVFHG